MRKFGRLWLVDGTSGIFDSIGPEPLSEGFSLEGLEDVLRKRKAPVKSVILDQRRIAGIGNIYADEALFEAGVLPTRLGGELTGKEVAKLHAAIRTVCCAASKAAAPASATTWTPRVSPAICRCT